MACHASRVRAVKLEAPDSHDPLLPPHRDGNTSDLSTVAGGDYHNHTHRQASRSIV